MIKVLCVCTGNISRSPMMQAVLQQHLGAAFLVESAGVREALAGRPANHRSVACLKERGVDLSGHVSRWLGDLDLDGYPWIVCAGPDEAEQVRSRLGAHNARVIVANEHRGGIPDPYELGLAGYRDCLVLLDEVMPHVARRIRQAQSGVGVSVDELERFSFGDGPKLADSLLLLVLAGLKTATCWAARDGQLTNVGKRMIACDGEGRPRAVLETIALQLSPFSQVGENFARKEGEGDLSLKWWREAHQRYFERNGGFDPEMILWCEEFRLVEAIALPG